jgi:phospholipid-binding lipoprotein MlaA
MRALRRAAECQAPLGIVSERRARWSQEGCVLGILELARIGRLLSVTCLCIGAQVGHGSESDPWESWNIRVHAFNEHLDTVVLLPVATTYVRIVPSLARRGVSNVVLNILDVTVLLNNVLQLKIGDAASDSGRILLNTTVGLGGLIDVATEAGLERNDEDFGQTLGRWGRWRVVRTTRCSLS